jgi:hypothetical protein
MDLAISGLMNLRPMISALKALAVVTRTDVARHQETMKLRQVN